ncbi:hypothetical protein L9F63_002821, partial [Diploptera punctata]
IILRIINICYTTLIQYTLQISVRLLNLINYLTIWYHATTSYESEMESQSFENIIPDFRTLKSVCSYQLIIFLPLNLNCLFADAHSEGTIFAVFAHGGRIQLRQLYTLYQFMTWSPLQFICFALQCQLMENLLIV